MLTTAAYPTCCNRALSPQTSAACLAILLAKSLTWALCCSCTWRLSRAGRVQFTRLLHKEGLQRKDEWRLQQPCLRQWLLCMVVLRLALLQPRALLTEGPANQRAMGANFCEFHNDPCMGRAEMYTAGKASSPAAQPTHYCLPGPSLRKELQMHICVGILMTEVLMNLHKGIQLSQQDSWVTALGSLAYRCLWVPRWLLTGRAHSGGMDLVLAPKSHLLEAMTVNQGRKSL